MKSIFICAFLSATLFLQAQSSKTIKPKPDKAIVYLSGAELSYSESLALSAGATEIIIEGVSPSADENSISAFLRGGMVIDTKKGLRYPEAPKVFDIDMKYNFIINRINDSIEDMAWLVKDCNNKQAALQKERALLLGNRLMRGEFARDSLGLLKSTLDLLRSRLNNIDEEELTVDKRESKYGKITAKLNERLEYFSNLQSNNLNGIHTEQYNPIYQIIVSVEMEAAATCQLSLKYYVPTAGWMPRYDIMAGSGQEKIQLVHRAQVYQNTGVDWKDVSLTLSTSNPALGNTKPLLNAWNLYFGYPSTYSESVNKQKSMGYNYNQMPKALGKASIVTSDSKSEDMDDANVQVAEPIFKMGDNFLRMEYDIKTKYTIASDNKAHNVVVSSTEVPVTLTYMAVPKLEKDAFLMGKIANWEDLNLLPASARIYFDESYIGLTAIDPETTKDTLYMNLGRDRNIVVKRLAMKDKCKEQVLSEYKVLNKTFEITVRNTKAITLDFEIEDQIPVTNDPNIKITLLSKDGAIYNELTGKLTWKINVKSKDIKKLVFSYEVRYPKDKYVVGL